MRQSRIDQVMSDTNLEGKYNRMIELVKEGSIDMLDVTNQMFSDIVKIEIEKQNDRL